jgi:hypothetical protein
MGEKLQPRVFRTRAEKLGGHYHVRVFSAQGVDHTFAGIGTLVMDESDYAAFTEALRGEHLNPAREEALR